MPLKNQQQKWRSEYKYISPEYLLTALQNRCSALMRLDSNAAAKGFYNIRSIYFDDMYDTCFFENENGSDPREKFRIRIYNNDSSRISLELKKKEKTRCLKLSSLISLEQCEVLSAGKIPRIKADDSFLLKKLAAQMRLRLLKPVVMTVYERVPFVWKQGNVRVTFDRNIRSSCDFADFFSGNLACRPVLSSGENMIEVKFDEFLPDFINEILQSGMLRQSAFSKYYLCRKFSRVFAQNSRFLAR